MSSVINLTGMLIGAWKVLSIDESVSRRRPVWICLCTSCNSIHLVRGSDLRSGKSTICKSCARSRHGELKNGRRTAEYRIWSGMRDRCLSETNKAYDNYGGRGITICQRWLDSFAFFLEDMGRRPSSAYSIDRIDNNGNYEPGNCRWATMTTQLRNTRRSRLITINGVTLSMVEWTERNGIPYKLAHVRVGLLGWDYEKAVTVPPRKMKV